MCVYRYLLGTILLILVIGCSTQLGQTDDISLPKNTSIERMEEWNDWKFGLFIHWGPWSQTGIGSIWQIVRKDTGTVRDERFNLYRTFNPTEFDPAEWAKIAKSAGMRYMVFTTKHHDGFSNFKTTATDLNIFNPNGPWSKSASPDITGELAAAFRSEGLKVGHYFSHIDWHHPDGQYFSIRHWNFDKSKVDSNPEMWNRFVAFEKQQVHELITQYGDMDIFWFDIRWPHTNRTDSVHHQFAHPKVGADMLDIVKMMRDTSPNMIINDRGVDVYGDFATPEQRIPDVPPAGYWETNMTISDPNRRKSGGFWYKGEDALYKSQQELLRVMAEVFSKGGNFLLNVGPKPNGKIPEGEVEALRKIGEWMAVNGEAVYGTKRSPLSEAPEWGFITRKGQTLYLYVFEWPADGGVINLKVANSVVSSNILGSDLVVESQLNAGGIRLHLPINSDHEVVSVIAVELEGDSILLP